MSRPRPRAEDVAYVEAMPPARAALIEHLRKPAADRLRSCATPRAVREIDELNAHTLQLADVPAAFKVDELAFSPEHVRVARQRLLADVRSELFTFPLLHRAIEQGGELIALLAESWSSEVPGPAMGRGLGVRVGAREVRGAARISAIVSWPGDEVTLILLRTRPLPRETMFDVLATGLMVCAEALTVVEDLRDSGAFTASLDNVPLVLPAFRATRMAGDGSPYGPREHATKLLTITRLLLRHAAAIPFVICDAPYDGPSVTPIGTLDGVAADAVVTVTCHDALPGYRVVVNRIQGARPSFATTMQPAGPAGDRLTQVVRMLEEPRLARQLRRQRQYLATVLNRDALRSSLDETHDLFAAIAAGHLAGHRVAA